MPVSSGITIRITDQEGEVPEQVIKVENAKQFRALLWDREGRLRVLGKAPWQEMRKAVPGLLRDCLRNHDILAAEARLQEDCPSLTWGSLEALFRQMSGEVKAYFRRECGKADGPVVFHIFEELVRAASWLKRKCTITRPFTEWEFPDSIVDKASANGIRRWLFRGR